MSSGKVSGEHYLLDTHAWVWLAEGKKELEGNPLVSELESASEESRLAVASISLWEIAMLESKGRIGFRIPCLQWIREALKIPGLSVIPTSAEIAADSAGLPGDFHGDPADRLIVAGTRSIGGTLVTRDRAILEYAKSGHLRAAAI
jgi:PIN domain nuclease of toxin-antitoxin system